MKILRTLALLLFAIPSLAQVPVSQQPAANQPLSGSELITIVQPGFNSITCPVYVGPTGNCNVQISVASLLNTFPSLLPVCGPYAGFWNNTPSSAIPVCTNTLSIQTAVVEAGGLISRVGNGHIDADEINSLVVAPNLTLLQTNSLGQIIQATSVPATSVPAADITAGNFISGVNTTGGSAPVGVSDTQTLTNKSISGASNTITAVPAASLNSPGFSATGCGTITGSWPAYVWNTSGCSSATPAFSTITGGSSTASFNMATGGSFGTTGTGTNQATSIDPIALTVPNTAPSAAGSYMYSTNAITGTGTPSFDSKTRSALFYLNYSDTIPYLNQGVGSTGIADVYLTYQTLNTGWDGFRGIYEAYSDIEAPPHTLAAGGNTISTNVIPTRSLVKVHSNMGGLVGSHLGASGVVDGMTSNVFTPALPTGANAFPYALQTFQGYEYDINTRPGERNADRRAIVINLGACDATDACDEKGLYTDDALGFGTGDNFASSAWDIGISTGSYSDASGFNLTSTFVGSRYRMLGSFTQPTLWKGLDLQATQFAQAASQTFTISSIATGDGSLTTLTLASTITLSQVVGADIVVTGLTGSCAVYNTAGYPVFVTQNPTTTTVTYATIGTAAGCTGGTAVISTRAGAFLAGPGFWADPQGNTYASSFVAGSGGFISQTGVVSSVAIVPKAGYTGGAYCCSTSFPTVQIDPPANGGTAATGTISSMFLDGVLLMDGNGNNLAPTGAGCTNGTQTFTVTGGTGTAATFTATVSGGAVTAIIAIGTSGPYSALPGGAAGATGQTTGGGCATQPSLTLLFGITSITVSGGSGYPAWPAPLIRTTGAHGYSGQINTPVSAVVTVTPTTIPLAVTSGIAVSGGAITLNSTAAITPNSGNISAASWGLTGLIFGTAGTQTLTDTTSTTAGGTVTTEPAWSLPVYNFQCSAACTITNSPTLYIPAPTLGGNVTGTAYSLMTQGAVKVSSTFNATGLVTGTAGATFSGGTFTVNATANNFAFGGSSSASGTFSVLSGTSATGAINLGTGTSGTIILGNSSNTGKTQLQGLSTGTAADTLCLTAGGVIILQSAACTISSERFKHGIIDYTADPLAAIERLRVVSFYMNEFEKHNRDANFYHHQIGLLAENIAEVAPDCAYFEPDMQTPKSYRPECITAVLVKGTQKLDQRTLTQQSVLSAQEIYIKAQAAKIDRQQWEIYGLAAWCAALTGFMFYRRRVAHA